MSADSSGRRGPFTYWRVRFRVWRGTRPFWAGLYTALSGLPIAYLPYANVTIGHLTLAMSTTAGAGSLIIGVLLVTLGLTMWFHSIVRIFAGVAAILLGLVSIPVANLGGFGIGLLLALVGGALSVSWVPGRPHQQPATYDIPHDAPVPEGAGDPSLPGPDDGEEPSATDTTAQANGGRNSAG
jgi:hypothetical protein